MALPPALRKGIFNPLHNMSPDNPTVQSLEQAHDELRSTMERIETGFQAAMANENQTPAANLKASDRSAQRRQTMGFKVADGALGIARNALKELEGIVNAPIAKPKDAAIAREIRDHVKGMSSDQRREFFGKALARKDVETIGAALAAPSYLSGMSECEQEGYAQRLKLAMFPSELKAIEAVNKGVDRIQAAANLVMNRVQKLHDPKELERLDGLDDAAKKALND